MVCTPMHEHPSCRCIRYLMKRCSFSTEYEDRQVSAFRHHAYSIQHGIKITDNIQLYKYLITHNNHVILSIVRFANNISMFSWIGLFALPSYVFGKILDPRLHVKVYELESWKDGENTLCEDCLLVALWWTSWDN